MEDLGLGNAQNHFRLSQWQQIHSPAPLAPFRSHLKEPFGADFNGRSSKPMSASPKEPPLPSHPPPPPSPAPAPSLGQNMDAVFVFDLCQAEKEIHFLQLLISEV